jgi:hypothetical protein
MTHSRQTDPPRWSSAAAPGSAGAAGDPVALTADERRAGQRLAAARAHFPRRNAAPPALRATPRRSRRAVPAALAAGIAGIGLTLGLGSIALSRGWLRPAAGPTSLSVAAGSATRVERRGRFHLSLRGPLQVELQDAGGAATADAIAVRLVDGGWLEVTAEGRAVIVAAAGRRVSVPRDATVDIEMEGADLRVQRVAGAAPDIDPGTLGGLPGPSAKDSARQAEPRPRDGVPGAPSPSAAPAPIAGVARAVAPAPATTPTAPAAADGPPARLPSSSPLSAGAAGRPATASGRATDPETAMVREALTRLRGQKDAAGALRRLDDYDRRFPGGAFADEARLLRTEALLALGRSREALQALEVVPAAAIERSRRLRVVRGELRAALGRCPQALRDFDALLAAPVGDEVEARARRGRAACGGL